jgi:hypothetical protein
MKNIILFLMIAMAPFAAMAQSDTQGNMPDSAMLQDDTVADNGEAGGITADEAKANTEGVNWLYLALGGVLIAVISAVITRSLSKQKKEFNVPVTEEPVTEYEEPKSKDTKSNAAETKKLRAEVKSLSTQLQALQSANAALERNLEIHNNFDNSYFTEAFRKLIAPMNESLEKGSEKEIIENLVKIMGHYSSLTRYKISKKQPYDEANIHYLLGQKVSNDNLAVDITGDTAVDKIPKHIKPVLDMLKQHGSRGLDDSIIAGYKIKNL